MVIGHANVKPEDALSYVLGYLCNDVSAETGKKKKGRSILSWKDF